MLFPFQKNLLVTLFFKSTSEMVVFVMRRRYLFK